MVGGGDHFYLKIGSTGRVGANLLYCNTKLC